MKHLLHEQQENLTELKAEGVLSLRRAQKDHWEQEEETWKEKCSLNTRLKEQELANEAAISKLCIVCPVRCLIPSVGAGGGSCLPDSLWGRAGWDFWCRNGEKGLLGDPSPTVGSCESTGEPKATVCINMGSESFPKKQEGIPGHGLAWHLVVSYNTEFVPHRNMRRRWPGCAVTSSCRPKVRA